MSTTEPPQPLQRDSVEAKIILDKIWKRLWKQNEHFMGVIVGREGKGKSHTGIKIGELVDPTFTHDRVMFDPVNFLEHLQDWKENNETQGKFVVIDEAGVGVGVRTWYDKDQIALNQVLQIIRSENMGVVFTLPRLSELDSQTRGRMHALMIMTEVKEGEYAKLKWHDWDPTRDGRGEFYRERPQITREMGMENVGPTISPKLSSDRFDQTVDRLSISPPSEELTKPYEQAKTAFQRQEYQSAIEEMDDETDDEQTVKEVAMEIADGAIAEYVDEHSQNGTPYINTNLIRADYELSHNDAKTVKDLLNRQYSESQLEQYL